MKLVMIKVYIYNIDKLPAFTKMSLGILYIAIAITTTSYYHNKLLPQQLASDCCYKERLFSAEEDRAIITIVIVGHLLELRQPKLVKIAFIFTACDL